jgi:hypothetical protein
LFAAIARQRERRSRVADLEFAHLILLQGRRRPPGGAA